MAICKYTYNGVDTYDESLEIVDYMANSSTGLVYTPTTPLEDTESVNGYAYHTHYAFEGPNVHWIGVKCELTRSSSAATPEYRNIIGLYGVNSNLGEELIGEKVYTTIDSTPTVDYVNFDLKGSSSQPTFVLTDDTSTSPGYIQVDLPMRYYDNYDEAYITVLGTTPVYCATPGEYDTSIYFATPAPWTDSSPCTLTITEYGGSAYTTDSLNVSSTSVFSLGFDGVDSYDALRLKFDTTTTSTPYTLAFNSIEYRYKV